MRNLKDFMTKPKFNYRELKLLFKQPLLTKYTKTLKPQQSNSHNFEWLNFNYFQLRLIGLKHDE